MGDNNITGIRLRELRKGKMLTLRDVEKDTNVSYSSIAAIERGMRSCNTSTLKILADYYQVSTDYLLGKNDNATPDKVEVDIALFNATKDLTEAEKKQVLGFVNYIKGNNSGK